MSQKSLTPKEKARDAHYRRTYGITLAEYNWLRRRQKYRCKVCRRHESEFKTRLSVDHDHSTLEIRGLLCTYCNRYVVGRHRDWQLLQRASRYLKPPHTGWIVPPKKKKRKAKK